MGCPIEQAIEGGNRWSIRYVLVGDNIGKLMNLSDKKDRKSRVSEKV